MSSHLTTSIAATVTLPLSHAMASFLGQTGTGMANWTPEQFVVFFAALGGFITSIMTLYYARRGAVESKKTNDTIDPPAAP